MSIFETYVLTFSLKIFENSKKIQIYIKEVFNKYVLFQKEIRRIYLLQMRFQNF